MVFHLARIILEGMIDLPSLQVFQAIVDINLIEDSKGLVKLLPKLANKVIVAFEKHIDIHHLAFPFVNKPLTVGRAYFVDFSTRSTQDNQNIQPKVVCLVNSNASFIVSRISSQTIHATLLRVKMDSCTRPIIIGMMFVESLSLIALDLEPFPFIIVTLIRVQSLQNVTSKIPCISFSCGGKNYLFSLINEMSCYKGYQL